MLAVSILRFLLGVSPLSVELLAIFLGVFGFMTVLVLLRPAPRRAEAARWLDHCAADAADRFTTWLAIEDTNAWASQVRAEISDFSSRWQTLPVGPKPRTRAYRVLLVFLAAIAFLQVFHTARESALQPERERVAALLDAAIHESADVFDPDAPVTTNLADARDAIRNHRTPNPTDAAIRALSQAESSTRSAATASRSDPASSASSPMTGGDATSDASSQSGALTSEHDIGEDSPQLSGEELTRRLERLANALAEKKREAANPGSGERGNSSAPGGGESWLDELMAGNGTEPGTPGPFAREGGNPGPGNTDPTEQTAEGQSPTAPVQPDGGPDLTARTQARPEGASVGLAVVSRDGAAGSDLQPQPDSGIPLEFSEQSMDARDIPPESRNLVRKYFESLKKFD